MTKHPLALAIAVVLAASAALSGCDRTSKLTEQEHIQRAKDFEDTGNLKGSIIELKNALQKNPASPQARLLLGQVYLKAGLGAEAEKELKRAEELGIAHESLQVHLARSLLLQGNFAQALENSMPPDRATARQQAQLLSLQGEARLGLRQVDSGCALFNNALQLDRNLVEAYRGLARCAMHAKEVARARSYLQAAIKIEPDAIENWMLLGEIDLDQNDLAAAEKSFAKALALQPENRNALLKHALIALSTNQKEAARKDLTTLRNSAPKSADLLYLDAAFKYYEGNYQAALPAVQQLLNVQPNHVQANLLAGLTLYEMKSYQQAITHLAKVVERNPARQDARKYLASAQLMSGDADAAYKTIAPIALTSRDPQVLAMLSQIQQIRGESSQAIASLTEAKHLAPGNAAILTRLAYMHFQSGDDAQALTELEAVQDTTGQVSSADVLAVTELIRKKNATEALSLANRIVQRAPDNAQAHNLKGMAQVSSGDIKGAYASFEKAHAINPDAIASILNLYQLDKRANTPDKSIARLTRYVENHPGHAQAMTTLAELEAAKGNRQAALKWIDQALKANPKYLPAHAMRVHDLIAAKQYDQALSASREAINSDPTNPIAQSLLADVQFAQNDMVNAAASYAKLAQKAASPKLLYRLATAQVATGKRSEAIATLEKSRKYAPGDLETLAFLSNLQIAEKNFIEAKKIVAELKERFPHSATGWYQEGLLFNTQGQTGPALTAYRQAHLIAKDSRSVTYLHTALVRDGKVEEANTLLKDWLAQYPKDVGVRHHLAASLTQSGQARQAIEQYLQILKLAPDDALALNNLAALYQTAGNLNKALSYAEKAARAAPQNPLILDTLGWAQVQSGKLEKGIATLRTSYAALPGNAEVALHLATALAKQGSKREARAIAQAALQKPSAQTEALRALLSRL